MSVNNPRINFYAQFQNATIRGDFPEVKRILKIDSISAMAAMDDNKALVTAAERGYLNIVNLLLEIPSVIANAIVIIGKDRKGKDFISNRALCGAAGNGHLSIVNRLLEIKAVRTHAAERHNDALEAAAFGGHLAVVKRLLEIPAVLENVTIANNTVLCAAADGGHLSIVNYLLEITSIIRSFQMGNHLVLERLIEQCRDSADKQSQCHLIILFRILQSYQKADITFPPDIKFATWDSCEFVYIYKSLIDFFIDFSSEYDLVYQTLQHYLRTQSIINIINAYSYGSTIPFTDLLLNEPKTEDSQKLTHVCGAIFSPKLLFSPDKADSKDKINSDPLPIKVRKLEDYRSYSIT